VGIHAIVNTNMELATRVCRSSAAAIRAT